MEAKPLSINKLFQSGGDIQYVLPYFQREYAWERPHWADLYADVKEIYDADWKETLPEHFMGALVVIQDGESIGTMSRYTLVDGQQRLTSISLLLCALKEILEPGDRLRGSIEKLLVNPDKDHRFFYKVVPTQKYDDQKAYFAIVDGDHYVKYESSVVKAFKYFLRRLEKEEKEIDAKRFFDSIVNQMQIVFITLSRHEKPYKIFESLNAKGKELSQADLVRNYVAMRLPPEHQEKVFNKYWADIDRMLKEKRKKELSAFLRHYLARVSYTLPNEKQVYHRFRDHMEQHAANDKEFIEEIRKLHQYAGFYNKLLRPDKESISEISDGIRRLNTIVESVSYPFLLQLYELFESRLISDVEFAKALGILENYGVRRFLADAATSYHNKMFATLPRDLDTADFIPSLTMLLLNKNYPSNYSIRQNLKRMNKLGNLSRKKYILVLQSIDRHLAKGTDGYAILEGDATIEHIMPQTLDEDWEEHIGDNWIEVKEDFLNNLGNLTLVTQPWNVDMSNGPFQDKKEKLEKHALLINRLYFCQDISAWNDKSILARTEWLTKYALELWYPLGSLAPPSDVMGSVPSRLMVNGRRFEVESWRDVMNLTVEELLPVIDDFDNIAWKFNVNFSRQSSQFLSSHELSNGWWLKQNLSDNAIFTFCRKLVQASGLHDHDWNVDY